MKRSLSELRTRDLRQELLRVANDLHCSPEVASVVIALVDYVKELERKVSRLSVRVGRLDCRDRPL